MPSYSVALFLVLIVVPSLSTVVSVAFEQGDRTVSEDQASLQVCVSVSAELERPVVVTVSAADITATSEHL